jgi:hypothetical protein
MTLHFRKIGDRTHLSDGMHPLHVPVGWQIADGNDDDARVCGAHDWQSSYLIFANGDAYGTNGMSHYKGAAQCCSGDELQKIKFCLTPENREKISRRRYLSSTGCARCEDNG